MVLTYQQLLLGHSIVSRRDHRCEKCAVSDDDEDAVGFAPGTATARLLAVVPFAALFARTGDPELRPRARRDDSYYATFILKWLTPHSVPSA
jgi:hypothetical protein